jgi:hypothetical protein
MTTPRNRDLIEELAYVITDPAEERWLRSLADRVERIRMACVRDPDRPLPASPYEKDRER